MQRYNMVVLGAGSAGLTVAIGSALLGAKTALIENHKIGGDCTHYGCIPSKALIKSAKVAQHIKKAEDYGLQFERGKLYTDKVFDHVQATIKKIEKTESEEVLRKYGVDVYMGSAVFVNSHVLKIDGKEIYGKKIAICTGSHAAVPPMKGLKEAGFITNKEIFSLKKIPARLAVVGGGPIGIEMAQALQRLGSQVTVIARSDILGKEDSEIKKLAEKFLTDEGIKVLYNEEIKEVKKRNQEKILALKKSKITVDQVLIATGRSPNVQGLNLEAAGVQYDERGIKVDQYLQTTAKNIFACGDVIGKYLFTHVANYEGRSVVRNALFPFRRKVNYAVTPWTTFTDPEIAHVGLTEDEAREKNISYKAYRFETKHIDRAITENEEKGMIKVITDTKGMVLGAHIVAANAGEMIHEWILAIREKIPLSKIQSMVHVYPTMALGNKQAADLAAKEKLTKRTKRRLESYFKWLIK